MKIRIINHSKHPLTADEHAEWIQVEELEETGRGAGGLEHTGTR